MGLLAFVDIASLASLIARDASSISIPALPIPSLLPRIVDMLAPYSSDGKLKFGEIKREGGQGKYDVTVEPSGAFQKDLPGNSIGVLHLGSSLPG